MRTADHRLMHILGAIPLLIKVTTAGGQHYNTRQLTYVTDSMENGLYLSREALIDLGVWRKFLTGLVRFSSSGGIAVPGCKVTSCGLGQTGRDVGLAFYVIRNDNLVRKRELGRGGGYKNPLWV